MDGDDTTPGIPADAIRRRRVSSHSALDSAAILQGALELHADDPERQREAIREALARATEQGRLMGMTDQAGTEEDLARERAARRELELRLSDARHAYLSWERDQDPKAAAALRQALTGQP